MQSCSVLRCCRGAGFRRVLPTSVASTAPSSGHSYKGMDWEGMWSAGLKPGQAFDKSGSSPRLVQLLSTGVAKGQRCVVPGCGRGYDLAALVTAGASHAVGVEISNTAAAAARAYIAHDSALTSEQQERITVQEADYLQDGAGTNYDLGVDYTFFCALHPSLRPSWAAAWAKALRPGGLLITLIFPVDPAADPNHGPPFPVHPDLYKQALASNFTLQSLEVTPPELSHSDRAGKEWLGLWVRN
ncbi:S-adenosyl-L-methionine-dependent methyltransferase [Haematococcus lacustris]